jgi:hypothetical protein
MIFITFIIKYLKFKKCQFRIFIFLKFFNFNPPLNQIKIIKIPLCSETEGGGAGRGHGPPQFP